MRRLGLGPLILTFLFAGCGLTSRDEVARVASPDGRVEAVLVETNGGATTSFGYEILLIEKDQKNGERIAMLYGSTRNESAYGANLKWLANTELAVEFQAARQQQVEKSVTRVAGRDVRVVLRPGVSDATAPAGGMLYNLERKK